MKEQEEFQLSKLVEHLSHELRTPLSAILGYSELLEKSENLDDSEKIHLEKITEGGSQLLDVINDIIEISNIESGYVEPEEQVIVTKDFIKELKSKFKSTARLKEIGLSVEIDPAFWDKFRGDEKKIKTILYSLINNAIKFTEKGKVKVVLSLNKAPESQDLWMLQVEIYDTGIGLSKDQLKHIFKPFWQVSSEQKRGTGLGLTTCQKLVQILNGEIEIESEFGKGTKVYLQIPIKKYVERLDVNEAKYVQTNQAFSKNLKALIVDDLPINRTLARIMLEMKNFQTVEAQNGKEAIAYYNGHNPDVVLMDISMPVMNGIEAMEKIRNINGHGKSIPIIAVTAGGHAGSRSELIERGFSEYIQKPFRESELLEKISLFLPLSESKKQTPSLNSAAF